ncbi:MAG: PadR family transcriptional regulator [Pseudomonadota bacterium]|nr:PadR family transcriptional regulator [Pseudomonadota bacterium]
MFFRHLQNHEAFRGHGPAHEAFARFRHRGGFGGREGRMFDSGELRLVILALIAEKPRHGYEVIKELGERVGGDYSPSPGVVYPTLTLLEDMGYASAALDSASRKLYTITPEGQSFLAENKAQVDAIFARLTGGNDAGWSDAGSVIRAMLNLRATVKLRLRGRQATREQLQAITDALDAAAKTIERV